MILQVLWDAGNYHIPLLFSKKIEIYILSPSRLKPASREYKRTRYPFNNLKELVRKIYWGRGRAK